MLGEYRKIFKADFFNRLLRMYFYNSTGSVWEGSLYALWLRLRSYNRRYSLLGFATDNLRNLFDLRLGSFVLLLGIFIYPVWANEFIEHGYARVNGLVTFSPNKMFAIGDVMQFDFQRFRPYFRSFSLLFWTDALSHINFMSFIMVCETLTTYMLTRLPYRYEINITHDLFLNSRLFMYLLRRSHPKEAKNPNWERLLGDRRVYARQKVKIGKPNDEE